ncbi:MAG: hypothetical protein DI498_13795 [Paracoccus denitrificans]|nr:MAG: hypothetical protein DI498_13795 [Paracoccus denitrificans]PZO82880.1 MAG: hypothetical protein DI633_13795 [Paracoccus denitrificans]
MHGGALIAMLTFTSGILTNSTSPVRADSLVDPMMRFAFGLACAAAASAGTYLTNYCYLAGAHNQTLIWQHPYIEKGRASKRWEGIGVAFHVTTVLLAVGSLALFVCGFWGVKEALSAARKPPQVENARGIEVNGPEARASDPVDTGPEVQARAGDLVPKQDDAP